MSSSPGPPPVKGAAATYRAEPTTKDTTAQATGGSTIQWVLIEDVDHALGYATPPPRSKHRSMKDRSSLCQPKPSNPDRSPSAAMLQPLRCGYRESVRLDRDRETACCGLLRDMIGADDLEMYRLGRDACETCCRSVLPSAERINQVVASFLHVITGQIIERNGVSGCGMEKAKDLQQWAGNHLEVCPTSPPDTSFRDRFFYQCCYLGDCVGQRVEATWRGHTRVPAFRCLHDDHGHTTEEECHSCRDWARSVTRPRRLQELLGEMGGNGHVARKWAVGVTTAPRRQPTLEICLDYLLRSEWDDVHLFVEQRVPDLANRHHHLPVTLRRPSVGAWPNYYLALQELLCRHPDADALMIVQDDACFYDRECVRTYLDRVLWPSDPPGLLSLYCSSAYTNEHAGWHTILREWVWGAVAFVFPRERARQFVTDPEVIAHRWKSNGLRLIDEVIGKWARREHVPIHFPTPSLVQHLGVTSTLWPGGSSSGFRRADWFAGSNES